MRPNVRRAIGLVLVVILAGAVAGACADDDTGNRGVVPTSAAAGDSVTATPAVVSDLDLNFIDSMVPHHEGAIQMAELALERAEHQEIRELAQAIISAQQDEITRMTAWRNEWFGAAPPSGGMPGMGAMPGMVMHSGDMHMLMNANPFDKAFIDMMIVHHEAAIAMAQQILTTTQREEIRELANAIIAAQQKEIDDMRQWRAAWYP